MKTIMTILLTVVILIGSSGCLTHSVLEGNKRRVALRKAIESNNKAAIQAIKRGEDVDTTGIHVTTMDAITERPVLLAGAGVGDGLIIWGGVEGVQWLANSGDGDGDRSSQSSDGERDSNTMSIEGDGNTINVRGDETNIGEN